MVELLILELNMEWRSVGSTTWRWKDLARRLEPDECYYIASEARVRGETEIDLMVDPPPNLAIEVDLTRPGIEKLEIHAALGVPEVWTFDGRRLRVLAPESGARYREVRQSAAFPFMPIDELERSPGNVPNSTETRFLRSFRDRVVGELAGHVRP